MFQSDSIHELGQLRNDNRRLKMTVDALGIAVLYGYIDRLEEQLWAARDELNDWRGGRLVYPAAEPMSKTLS